jgi:fucose 4-O-acetylase-like acetyltransferase
LPEDPTVPTIAAAAPPPAATSPTVRELVAATPADRDRVVDLLRGLSILVVAVGHWLLAVVTLGPDGQLTGGNALAEVPLLQRATWLFQVMPLFFLVGGYANAVSWRSTRRRGTTYADWLAARVRRLVGPTTVFVGAWSLLALLLGGAGVAADGLSVAARLVAVPLWFLAVYVVVIAVAPAMLWLHARAGLAVPVVLVAAAATVDALHRGGTPAVGWLNFALVWLTPQQLGFAWADGRLTSRRRTAGTLVAGGLAALVLLTTVGPYPVSMVGVPGATASNNSPPTVALVALTVLQLGLVLLLRPAANRWLSRPRVWAAVVVVNARAMTVFLWHLTALVVVAAAVVPTGLFGDAVPGTPTGGCDARCGWPCWRSPWRRSSPPSAASSDGVPRPPRGTRRHACWPASPPCASPSPAWPHTASGWRASRWGCRCRPSPA